MNQEDVIRSLQERLTQAEAELTIAQRRKSSVMAMAVHDLRTPLAIIQGYSQLLAAELPADNDATREYIASILTHAESLGKMVDNLMALDLLESGRFRLVTRPGDLNERTGEAIAQVEGLTDLKDITVSYRPHPSPVRVEIDEAQIGRILYNLLSHTTKYARPGSQLQIDVSRQGEFGRVSLLDPNRTLKRDILARLFDLADIDSASPTSLQGTDIGLVLARLIAEKHHGYVEAVGGTGKGVILALYLPTTGD